MSTATRATALLAAAILLAGCGRASTPSSAPEAVTTSAPAATTTTVATASTVVPATAPTSPTTRVPPATTTSNPAERLSTASRLRIDGLGPVRIGMTAEAARAAAGVPLALRTGPYCNSLTTTNGPAGVSLLMAGGDHVDWVTVFERPITTLSGIGVGSTQDQVLAAYPGQVRVVNPGEAQHRAIFHAKDPGLANLSLVFQIVDSKVTLMTAGVRSVVEADEACG